MKVIFLILSIIIKSKSRPYRGHFCPDDETLPRKIKEICELKEFDDFLDETIHQYDREGGQGKICFGSNFEGINLALKVMKFEIRKKGFRYEIKHDKKNIATEIAYTKRLENEFDFVKMYQNTCYSQEKNFFNKIGTLIFQKIEVGYQMLKYEQTLKQKLKKFQDFMKELDQIVLNEDDPEVIKKLNRQIRQIEIIQLQFALKLSFALGKLHEMQVAHFDIKPDNIFLQDEFTPVIGDMGLLQTFEESQNEQGIWGTSTYIGELGYYDEQFFHKNEQADLYALGVTFYEIFFKLIKSTPNKFFLYEEDLVQEAESQSYIKQQMIPIIKKLIQESDSKEKVRGDIKEVIVELLKIHYDLFQDTDYKNEFINYFKYEKEYFNMNVTLNKYFQKERYQAFYQRLYLIMNVHNDDILDKIESFLTLQPNHEMDDVTEIDIIGQKINFPKIKTQSYNLFANIEDIKKQFRNVKTEKIFEDQIEISYQEEKSFIKRIKPFKPAYTPAPVYELKKPSYHQLVPQFYYKSRNRQNRFSKTSRLNLTQSYFENKDINYSLKKQYEPVRIDKPSEEIESIEQQPKKPSSGSKNMKLYIKNKAKNKAIKQNLQNYITKKIEQNSKKQENKFQYIKKMSTPNESQEERKYYKKGTTRNNKRLHYV